VYAVPAVSPFTVIGEVVDVPSIFPGLDTARYVTVPPLPVKAGAVKGTEADVDEGDVTVPTVGVPGTRPEPELTLPTIILGIRLFYPAYSSASAESSSLGLRIGYVIIQKTVVAMIA